jgi:hypothetical protein
MAWRSGAWIHVIVHPEVGSNAPSCRALASDALERVSPSNTKSAKLSARFYNPPNVQGHLSFNQTRFSDRQAGRSAAARASGVPTTLFLHRIPASRFDARRGISVWTRRLRSSVSALPSIAQTCQSTNQRLISLTPLSRRRHPHLMVANGPCGLTVDDQPRQRRKRRNCPTPMESNAPQLRIPDERSSQERPVCFSKKSRMNR